MQDSSQSERPSTTMRVLLQAKQAQTHATLFCRPVNSKPVCRIWLLHPCMQADAGAHGAAGMRVCPKAKSIKMTLTSQEHELRNQAYRIGHSKQAGLLLLGNLLSKALESLQYLKSIDSLYSCCQRHPEAALPLILSLFSMPSLPGSSSQSLSLPDWCPRSKPMLMILKSLLLWLK